MKKVNNRFWLAAVLLCLTPIAMANGRPPGGYGGGGGGRGCDPRHPDKRCQQVPEGGSSAIYLLGVGLTCLGAMFIRSRASKSDLS